MPLRKPLAWILVVAVLLGLVRLPVRSAAISPASVPAKECCCGTGACRMPDCAGSTLGAAAVNKGSAHSDGRKVGRCDCGISPRSPQGFVLSASLLGYGRITEAVKLPPPVIETRLCPISETSPRSRETPTPAPPPRIS